MSDLIKTSLSLENCSFHPQGERSSAGSGLENDLALKALVFPTRFGATWLGRLSSGSLQATLGS